MHPPDHSCSPRSSGSSGSGCPASRDIKVLSPQWWSTCVSRKCLQLRSEVIRQQWQRLAAAAGLAPDQMRHLIEYDGGLLKRRPGAFLTELSPSYESSPYLPSCDSAQFHSSVPTRFGTSSSTTAGFESAGQAKVSDCHDESFTLCLLVVSNVEVRRAGVSPYCWHAASSACESHR